MVELSGGIAAGNDKVTESSPEACEAVVAPNPFEGRFNSTQRRRVRENALLQNRLSKTERARRSRIETVNANRDARRGHEDLHHVILRADEPNRRLRPTGSSQSAVTLIWWARSKSTGP